MRRQQAEGISIGYKDMREAVPTKAIRALEDVCASKEVKGK